jgi:hypothetical protein
MSWSCSGTKPNYDKFWNNYLYYANISVPALEVSRSFLLGVWYQEWGIPYNNPGNILGLGGKLRLGMVEPSLLLLQWKTVVRPL